MTKFQIRLAILIVAVFVVSQIVTNLSVYFVSTRNAETAAADADIQLRERLQSDIHERLREAAEGVWNRTAGRRTGRQLPALFR